MKLDDFLMRLWMDGDDEIYLWIVKFLFMTGKTATFEMERCLFMDGKATCLWMDKCPFQNGQTAL